ncbi:MAG: prephenate dehydrogenase/arogenate dehydrogenase family protein [Planctomycetes bacterium]|nr:prephenate dehydrogenase/arogenate dehydrogenase family protein [Planctomycetota bacterium]MCW8134540.1 prephenate dehydrogenase/arogenate dehydrogenase family protein [Planctomycetota bacterium]
MDITELRENIDQVDAQLVQLLAKRLEFALEINRAKRAHRMPLRDAEREAIVLGAAQVHTQPPLDSSEALDLMRMILEFSRGAVKRRITAEGVEPLHVAIIGVGLIGGSIARALKRANQAHTISGVDLPHRLVSAQGAGLFKTLHEPRHGKLAVQDADVVFLCAPPSRNLELLAAVMADAKPGAIVTDVGGVKRAICDAAASIATKAVFIGGHPMAGKATAGFENSTASLFESRAWVLSPERGVDKAALRRLKALIESTGASVQLLTGDEHDRIVPAVSHLPQLAAIALTLTVGGRDHGIAGPALMDMTRLAESSPHLWQELLAASRTEVVGEVQRLRTYLTEIEMALGLHEPLLALFERAAALRKTMVSGSVVQAEAGE